MLLARTLVNNAAVLLLLLMVNGEWTLVNAVRSPSSGSQALVIRPRRPNPGGNAASVPCKVLPTADRKQLDLCARFPDVLATSMQGLRIAVHECQKQFKGHRWNCSSGDPLDQRAFEAAGRKQHALLTHHGQIMRRGYRESAFLHALTSAGVAHAVARACSLGKLMSCGCGKGALQEGGSRNHEWRWSGCNHNMDFGLQISELLLDSTEKGNDIHSKINTHNNRVGRDLVSRNMKIRCKCHGMSGSCELKTCWRASVSFKRVGATLKDRYGGAVLVGHTNSNGRDGDVLGLATPATRRRTRRQRKKPLRGELVYLERSPSFCEPDATLQSPGTRGRTCNRSATSADNCDSMCCGRGYNTVRRRRVERCQCRFRWCCHVECRECVYEEWVTVCK